MDSTSLKYIFSFVKKTFNNSKWHFSLRKWYFTKKYVWRKYLSHNRKWTQIVLIYQKVALHYVKSSHKLHKEIFSRFWVINCGILLLYCENFTYRFHVFLKLCSPQSLKMGDFMCYFKKGELGTRIKNLRRQTKECSVSVLWGQKVRSVTKKLYFYFIFHLSFKHILNVKITS